MCERCSLLCLLCLFLLLAPGAGAAETKRRPTDRRGDPLPAGAVSRYGSTRLRVDRWVKSFAFWPDDRTLAALCSDGSIRLWDRTTGREVRRLHTRFTDPRAAILIPKSKRVALVVEDGPLLLWDSETGKTVWKQPIRNHGNRSLLVVAPDGKLLAESEGDGPDLFEVATGRKLRSLPGSKTEDTGFAFSPDNRILAVARARFPTELWDLRTGKEIRDLSKSSVDRWSSALAFSRDGKNIAVGGFERIVLHAAATGKERARFQTRWNPHGLTFTADGKRVLFGDVGCIHFLDLENPKKELRFKTNVYHQRPLLALSADGKVLAVGDPEGEYLVLHLLDAATAKELIPTEGHRLTPEWVAFAADGRAVFSGDKTALHVWEAATGKGIRQFKGGFYDSTLSADRKLLARPSIGSIELWDLAAGKKVRELKYVGRDAILDVAFSADAKLLLSAHNRCLFRGPGGKLEGQDGLHLWDLSTGKETQHIPAAADHLFAHLLVTPDGRLAISGSVKGSVERDKYSQGTSRDPKGAGQLHVWNLRKGRHVRLLQGHTGAIRALAVSFDSRLLASASADGTFRLWELASGKTIFTLPGDACPTARLALTPDGCLLATTSGAHAIALCSTATGKQLGQLPGDGSPVGALAFSPDGRRLASALDIGTVIVWDVAALHRRARADMRPAGSKKPEALWKELANEDATQARRALWQLVGHGDETVRLLKGLVKPSVGVDAKRLEQLLTDLDADTFPQRETASKELERLGDLAEPALRTAQKGRLSAEARRRIRVVLMHIDRKGPPAESLRELRAVEVLERIGSAEARALLTRLAHGAPKARLTQEAKAALARLQRH